MTREKSLQEKFNEKYGYGERKIRSEYGEAINLQLYVSREEILDYLRGQNLVVDEDSLTDDVMLQVAEKCRQACKSIDMFEIFQAMVGEPNTQRIQTMTEKNDKLKNAVIKVQEAERKLTENLMEFKYKEFREDDNFPENYIWLVCTDVNTDEECLFSTKIILQIIFEDREVKPGDIISLEVENKHVKTCVFSNGDKVFPP